MGVAAKREIHFLFGGMCYNTHLMNKKFIRVYKELDVIEIQKHLLIYGDLAGQCANCLNMDVRLDMLTCPQCKTEFRHVAFRNIKNHLPKVAKLFRERPQLTIVDCDDFKRCQGALKAEEFLK